MASGHGVPKPDVGNHPNRQVGRSHYADAFAARGEEYRRAEAGEMTEAEMLRVDINPTKYPQRRTT